MAVMMKDACPRQTRQDDPRPVPSTDRPPPVTVHAIPAVSDGSQLGPFGQNCIIMNVVECLHRNIWAECYLKDIIVCQQIVDFGNVLVPTCTNDDVNWLKVASWNSLV